LVIVQILHHDLAVSFFQICRTCATKDLHHTIYQSKSHFLPHDGTHQFMKARQYMLPVVFGHWISVKSSL